VQQFFFSNLSRFSEIIHFVSTRIGGVSQSPFDSLNIGFRTDDNFGNVISNWKILANENQINLNSLVIAHQVHEGNVVSADQFSQRGAWADPSLEIKNTDAFITSEKNICIIVKVADCVPILLYDPVNNVVAAIHASWRGTVNSVTSNTIESLINRYNCKVENIIAGIGPSIGPCCYETGTDVETAILSRWGSTDGFLTKNIDSERSNFDL